MNFMRYPLCSYCSDRRGRRKNLYPSEHEAARQAERAYVRTGVRHRVYECEHARNGFHITSRPRRSW